jgi:glycosyltransferase involved in cell wall biosynthesis
MMEEFIDVIKTECKIEERKMQREKILPLSQPDGKERKIIFSHRRALGDALMFSAGIRDFKLLFPEIRVNVDSNHLTLWDNSPYIDRSLKKGEPGVEYYKVGYPMVGNANNTAMHFSVMFLFDMIAVADLHRALPIRLGEFCAAFANGSVGDPSLGDSKKNSNAKEPFISLRGKYREICKNFVRQRGDLHLSEREKSYNLVKEVYGFDKYWIVAPGGKRDCTAKIWDWRRFQDVIDYFDGKIKFVVIGKSDLLVERLDNVIDLVDKFNNDIRGLISLVYHADGCVSPASALMHLAAAVPPRFHKERKPCVSIFGGREPTAWSWYCNHQVLHTNAVFSCCDNGGCWKARVVPLPKDPKHNKNLCKNTVIRDGRTIQACMDTITAQDVIRAIEKYYEGDIYKYSRFERKTIKKIERKSSVATAEKRGKEINLLGNLNTKGGGEQSLCMIAGLLQKSGWKVNLYPWGSVHDNYKNNGLHIMPYSFKNGMAENMDIGLPLLFYANDCVWDFAKNAQDIVDKSSDVIIGINYCNGSLTKAEWLSKTNKLKAIIFQNKEKKDEFVRDAIGFEAIRKIVLYGAIDLDRFLEVCPSERKKSDVLVVLKHCVGDYRKHVTEASAKQGEKIHIWQKNVLKEPDTKFYSRLLKDTKNTRFEFMEAHKELIEYFKNEPRMIFHKWDSIPVTEFLKRGHVYLYRTSNMWRDQYPRVVAEALAVGLPVLTEPRDGTKDRVVHGDTGFYAVHYDEFLLHLKTLQRKEKYRYRMGMFAKDWARQNLDPRRWIDVLEEVLYAGQ